MNFRIVCLVVLVVGATVVGTGPIATGTDDGVETGSLSAQLDEVDADDVRLDVALQSDGSAEWTVEFWVQLDDEESTAAFESLEAEIEEDPDAFLEEFATRMDGTVQAASDATDREMAADEFQVSTQRQSFGPEYGVVRYSFHWDGFADVEGDELRAGDAIEGLYLDDGTQLLVSWPDEYELTSAAPEPDDQRDRTVIWHGSETDFVTGEPRVVVSSGGVGIGTTAGVLVAIASIGLGTAWWYRSRSSGRADSSDESAEVPSSPPEEDERRDERPNPRDDLLSNEEQVLLLLEEYDGRMKQQTVVEELEWTDAKTSKVVSGLREEDKLESFRLGRENVLSLPDDE
ncbi:DUF7345 domain-containing protein [Natronobacterium texcoconense]|uniref:IclR helix-turn-helix domain-containing protein n=1 Tax=Natronobacterium texcoconense TaxID=1095778 RepID=A0A1H1GK37_NATTX|nr:hypothetical protein [Natronobacterium texcoconense]SDR13531.1 hypothetical protein SAMN04489842_2470 [Natronobacterium texcoconense]